MDKTTMPTNIYPQMSAKLIAQPNRWWAFFVLGFVVKIIILIPVMIELIFLYIAAFVLVVLINPFVVLFTGKYWDPAYILMSGIMKLHAKMYFFLFGLTNKYPGFDFTINDIYTVTIPKPTNPNRFFAIPVLGGLARIILLIPYMIYEAVIRNAAAIGMLCSSIPVLFTGKYPESTFEMERDGLRVTLAMNMYMVGFSDKYPSFWISMNHQTVKIILIILGTITMLGNGMNEAKREESYDQIYDDPQTIMRQNQNIQPDYETAQ